MTPNMYMEIKPCEGEDFKVKLKNLKTLITVNGKNKNVHVIHQIKDN